MSEKNHNGASHQQTQAGTTVGGDQTSAAMGEHTGERRHVGERKVASIITGIPLDQEQGLGPLTIGGYLREVTRRHTGREAVVVATEAASERWSYDELWAQSMRLARALYAAGVVKGTRVGLLMTNRLEFVAALFGTALAGGIAVPLLTFSTRDELAHLLQASCCSLLLVESRVLKRDFAATLAELEPALNDTAPGGLRSTQFPFLRGVAVVDSDKTRGAFEAWDDFLAAGETVAEALVDAAAATVAPSDPAVIFFSSGSTAQPKGVISAHRGVALQFWRWPRQFGLDSEVRCWTANGFFWSGTFSSALGSALTAGGTLVLQHTFQAAEALTLMARERVNFPLAWPHQWAQLEEAPNWHDVDLSAMRYVNPQSPIARHPTVTVDWDEPVHAYGNTETFTISAMYPSGTPQSEHRNSAGVPLPGNTLKIVGPFSGEVVPVGERGEIAVKGPTLMLGYLGKPLDETLDDQGFLRTGDSGYVDADGRLFWEGRLTDIIKTGGANVSPLEVDGVLETIPGVQVGKTVGVPHHTLGEIVVCCIVASDGAVLDEQGLRSALREKLASYKVPRRVLFFSEEEISTTGSAKIKTADLRELAEARLRAEDASPA